MGKDLLAPMLVEMTRAQGRVLVATARAAIAGRDDADARITARAISRIEYALTSARKEQRK